MNKEETINSIVTEDTTIVVKLENDSFLLKEIYSRSINLLVTIDKDSFLLKDLKGKKENFPKDSLKVYYEKIIKKYHLIQKEFYSKEDTLCTKMEIYKNKGELVEQITFYKEVEKVKQKKLLHGSELVFEQKYNKDGKPHDSVLMDFIIKYSRIDKDSTCIKIQQPYPEEFNCTFQCYADVGISKEETYELKDITVDSINGIGEICFATQPKIFLVGNFYHVKPNKKSLFEIAKSLDININKK